MTVTTEAEREPVTEFMDLYEAQQPEESLPVQLKWIPYYAWANRGLGEMRVWVRK